MNIKELLDLRKDLIKSRNNAEDIVHLLNEQLRDLEVSIKTLQSVCTHNPEWIGEGRHGSDKGTRYYKCTICNFEWDDSWKKK